MKKTLLLSILSLVVQQAIAQTPNCAPSVAAHRGFSAFFPENTIPAFEACIRVGTDYVEGDIVFTADRVPIMLHDETVDRTTNGTGPAARYTLEEIQALEAGFPDKFGDKFAGTRIPTLEEALDLVKANNTLFCFELKVPGIAKQVADIIREKGMESQGIVQSFLPQELTILKGYAPEIPCLLLSFSTGFTQYIDYAATIGIEYYGPGGIPEQSEIDHAHENNIKYWVYTIDDTTDMYTLMRMGADGIFTNRPDRLEGISKPLIKNSNDTLYANWLAGNIQWKLNGQNIAGATDTFYVAKQAGEYSFTAINAQNCNYESPVFSFGTSAIAAHNDDWKFVTFASAAGIFVTANASLNEEALVRLYDISGKQLMATRSLLAQPVALVAGNLAKGLYVVTVQTSTKVYTQKVVY